MKIERATQIIIRFGDHVEVRWSERRTGWNVLTGEKKNKTVILTLPTMPEACDWARAYAAARLVKYRVLVTDPGLRFREGEIGVEVPNDFPEKYDHKLQLDGLAEEPGFPLGLGPLVTGRIFYFQKKEVARV